MKKLLGILISFLFLIGCSEDSDPLSSPGQKHYRQVAYNYLSDEEKATIINWQKGKVEAGTYQSDNELFGFVVIESGDKILFATNFSDVKLFEGQQLVAVTFNTTVDGLLGPIILIIEPSSEKVIGYVLRM